MDRPHIIVYALFLMFEVFSVSFFMEFYKKEIRNNRCSVVEIRAVGFILSVLCVILLGVSNLMYPLLNRMFGSSMWLDYLVYLMSFYFMQMESNMKIVKRMVGALALRWLTDHTGMDMVSFRYVMERIEEEKGSRKPDKDSL